MQQPTHPRLHLRDAHDAHVVFEAVARRALVPITRRLNEAERRDLVRPGAVFVWFEAEDDSGLMRWTDGRSWGQSRMREVSSLSSMSSSLSPPPPAISLLRRKDAV